MADVIWSCRECGHDLIDWWCPRCEMLHSPVTIAVNDPPEYPHPEDDDDA